MAGIDRVARASNFAAEKNFAVDQRLEKRATSAS
jgi:hypothetical protein